MYDTLNTLITILTKIASIKTQGVLKASTMKVLIVSSLAWIQNGCLQSLKKFERIQVNLTTFFLT